MPLEHLPNAPLVEAIFEMRFPGEPAVVTRMHEYYDLIRESYPGLWVPNAQQGVAPALQPWEFRNQENSRTVALSVNTFAYRIRDYVDYPDFRRSVLPLAQQFVDLFGIRKVSRLAARYVNNIALLRLPGEPIRLKNYLNLGVRLPDRMDEDALEDIHLQFATRIDGSQVVVNLHHQLGEQGPPESLVFVLDCALVEDVSTENLALDIDKVHTSIEDTFCALVAAPYMRYLKGEAV